MLVFGDEYIITLGKKQIKMTIDDVDNEDGESDDLSRSNKASIIAMYSHTV